MSKSSLTNSKPRIAYRVKITCRAQRDLAGIYYWVNARSSDPAHTWYRRLRQGIRGLRDNPHRSAATPENEDFRHLLYVAKPHVYLVIYRILASHTEADILHVPHATVT